MNAIKACEEMTKVKDQFQKESENIINVINAINVFKRK